MPEFAGGVGAELEPEPESPGIELGDFVSFQSVVFGTVVDWLPDRQRWVVQLGDGRECAAAAEQLNRVRFEPFARVVIVGEELGKLNGECGEITGFLPDRNRWGVKLDIGPSTAARAGQLRLTDRPKPDGLGQSSECGCGGAEETKDAGAGGCVDKGAIPQLAGLGDADQALVELVAKEGTGNWDAKASFLAAAAGKDDTGPSGTDACKGEGQRLEKRWVEIAPLVRDHLATNPTMPCSHTCGTCPTRTSCHLHAELDIEDCAKPKSVAGDDVSVQAK